jgi:2-iminobutanoate/2-iminopropanoate deaminase
MGIEFINDTGAPSAVGTYSQGAKVGDTYFFSGQIGINPATGKIAEDFKTQAQQILENIDHLLKGCDLTRKNIVKTSIFLTDLNNFGTINELYEGYFEKPFPARSCVQVSKLPKDTLVEIEVIASR